jgi:hypothetical protein
MPTIDQIGDIANFSYSQASAVFLATNRNLGHSRDVILSA